MGTGAEVAFGLWVHVMCRDVPYNLRQLFGSISHIKSDAPFLDLNAETVFYDLKHEISPLKVDGNEK